MSVIRTIFGHHIKSEDGKYRCISCGEKAGELSEFKEKSCESF